MNSSLALTNKAGPATEQNKAIELQGVKGMHGILIRPPCSVQVEVSDSMHCTSCSLTFISSYHQKHFNHGVDMRQSCAADVMKGTQQGPAGSLCRRHGSIPNRDETFSFQSGHQGR